MSEAAVSPQDLLDRLPSVQELLDHPQVRRAAETWNRSTVAATLRSAIQDVGAEARKRAESFRGVTAADLVDRLVDSLDFASAAAPVTAVNATGELWPTGLVGPPLPDAAVEVVTLLAAGYTTPDAGGAAIFAELAEADDAWVAASHAAAVRAVLRALAGPAPVIVGRCDVDRLWGGAALGRLAEASGVRLHEVGLATNAAPADYTQGIDAAAPDGAFVVLAGRRSEADYAALSEAARRRGGRLVVDLGGACPIDLREPFGVQEMSARSALAAGADAVVFAGDGLVGGPPCGVVVGEQRAIAAVGQGDDATIVAASDHVRAMAAATAALFREPPRLRFTHPLYQLISAPEDNLRTRAERLAPQIGAAKLVAAAEPIAVAPRGPATRWGFARGASWAISVAPASGPDDALLRTLATADPPVHAVVDGERLVLDLRSVFPRQDGAVVSAFGPEELQ